MNDKFRERALEIIKKQNEVKKKSAAVDTLDPKIIEAKKRMDSVKPEKNYMEMAREHKLKYGGSLVDSMRWVEQNYPHKLREYIKAHNPEM